jgi:hypothetical protein
MKRLTPLKIFAVSAVLSSLALASAAARAGGDKTLAQIAGYREWSRVTREPIEVPGIPNGGG